MLPAREKREEARRVDQGEHKCKCEQQYFQHAIAMAKSHFGLVVEVGDSTVLCQSTKQKIVTKHSIEAELVGLSDKNNCVMQCWEFMTHLDTTYLRRRSSRTTSPP